MAQTLIPVATWGLTVTPNEEPEGAFDMDTEPGTLQLTMAAIDPDEDVSANEGTEAFKKPRATVKMIVLREMPEDDSEDDDEDMEMADLLDDDEEAESPNGEGPSDPKKSPKEMKRNALMKALSKDEDDVLANGAKAKGKAKASPLEGMDELDEDEEDDEDLDMPDGAEEHVLCTLTPDGVSLLPLAHT